MKDLKPPQLGFSFQASEDTYRMMGGSALLRENGENQVDHDIGASNSLFSCSNTESIRDDSYWTSIGRTLRYIALLCLPLALHQKPVSEFTI